MLLNININLLFIIYNLWMEFEIKEQEYSKWNDSVWQSVEKQLSLFQRKVADSMIAMEETIINEKEQDLTIKPIGDKQVVLGQQFYLEMIRPICVKKGYLPKKLPGKEDFQQQNFDSEEEEVMTKYKEKKVVVVEEKAKGKKGGKNNKNKNKDQQMKIQITKQNFEKDIQLVLKSYSIERLQIEFGFRQQKIQVKLMTFFYIAHYIRKNRVEDKIEDSVCFQLINILIKIVKIYKGLYGTSYMSQQQLMEISPTLILDLKMCIDGMKQFYKYQNKTILLKYPKLVYYTSYDKYFPTLDIKPYQSQIQFMKTVKLAVNQKKMVDNPTLILYKPMIGSGKTTASIALSQFVRDLKLYNDKNQKLQLVYCCVIPSVRIQVGRYAYNKQQKFQLAAMQSYIQRPQLTYPKVINSYSCRYQKYPQLMISDLFCAYEMLDYHKLSKEQTESMQYEVKNRKNEVKLGKLQRQNIVMFIDEPTAFCKSVDSKATKKLFDILANYPPKLLVLSSATLPSEKAMKNTIQLIRRKNPNLVVKSIQSKQFQIGCQYCSFKGDIIFPHTGVKNKQELTFIYNLLQKNPFLLRLYTGPSLFFLLRRCEKVGLQGLPQLNKLPEIKQQDITKSTFKILKILKAQDDELIEEVCKKGGEEDNIDFKGQLNEDSDEEEEGQEEKEKEEEKRKDYVNFKKMLRFDAHKFLGGCLIGVEDPIKFAHAMFQKWVHKIKPIKRLMEKYEKDKKQLQKEIALIEADPEMREEKKTQKISKLQSDKQPVLDFPASKKINTNDHYHKYCRNKQTVHLSMLIKPIPTASVGQELIDEVDDFLLKLLFCGVAVYKSSGISSKYLEKIEELASQNYLAYIITDESLCYGTNFPISNVIIKDNLAMRLNMNEMFQLIGRAGRVGQSWTARAFLEDKGLKMLRDYIHQTDSETKNDEGDVFEQIARYCLNNPQLRLKTLKSEIRYKDQKESHNIQILIKKKNQADNDLIKRLTLIPYLVKDNQILFLSNKVYDKVNYYCFPSSELQFRDIPTKMNENGEQIIDISPYYQDQTKYIQATINNAMKRILKDTLKSTVSEKGKMNEFLPKKYVDFFNKQTNTFCILIKVEQQQFTKTEQVNFIYQNLRPNAFQSTDITLHQLQKIVQQSKRIRIKIANNPLGLAKIDFQTFSKVFQYLSIKQLDFFQSIFSFHKSQGQKDYQMIISNVWNKEDIQYVQQSKNALTVAKFEDIVNINSYYYHIDKDVRAIWQKLQGKFINKQ